MGVVALAPCDDHTFMQVQCIFLIGGGMEAINDSMCIWDGPRVDRLLDDHGQHHRGRHPNSHIARTLRPPAFKEQAKPE